MSLGLFLPLFSQQEFSVDITRPKKFTGAWSKISVLYQGQEKGLLKNNSGLVVKGPVPADSIIELGFKLPAERPMRFFLYPNGTFNYKLMVRPGFMGGIKINDYSAYFGIEPADAIARKDGNILPKGLTVNKRNMSVSYIYEKELKSEEIRKQWMRQGGKITGRSLQYMITYASMAIKSEGTKTTTTIAGAGWNYTQNFYNLKLPEYKPGFASWKSLIYGYAMSVNLHMSSVSIKPPPTPEFESIVSGSFVMLLSGNAGYTLGLGKFKTEKEYKGIALDLTYKPSLVWTVAEGYNDTQFNYMGFGVDISRTSFSAFASRVAPKAKSKFSFFFLPPVKDNTPFMITAGYGLVWYR